LDRPPRIDDLIYSEFVKKGVSGWFKGEFKGRQRKKRGADEQTYQIQYEDGETVYQILAELFIM
jgi:hypothetical protein